MPLNGDPRRIYPEPAPARDRSPVHHKPGSINHQAAGNGVRMSMAAANASPAHPRITSRPLSTYSKDFDGQSDQLHRSPMTLGQPGPMRAGSRSRKPATATPSRVKSEQTDMAAERAAVAAGLKMDVPTTLLPQDAPPMKHQISQSTDSSVQERSWEQNGNHRSGYMGTDRQTHFGFVMATVHR